MKRILLLFFILGFLSAASAQDIHFSQFYASPLTLNPANTGKIGSKYRVAANYRDQWASVSAPYKTFSASYDMPFLYKQMKKNFFGAGIVVISDKSGTGELANQSIYLSFAYHQKIGNPRHPKHYASLGVQAGMVQKSVNLNKLVFASQYDQSSKSFSNYSLEKFNSSGNFSYADLTAGGMWTSYLSDNFSFYGGVAMHHLTKPKEQLLVFNTDQVLNNLVTFHLGSKIAINDLIYLNPSVLLSSQTRASEFTIGSSIAFLLNEDLKAPSVFYTGIYYRLADAAVVLMGVEVHNNRFGISYDLNVSNLKAGSKYKGGFELSLVHEGNPSTSPRKVIYCPRF
jgi:type IX secretion system PorP/SprF family membrane protein